MRSPSVFLALFRLELRELTRGRAYLGLLLLLSFLTGFSFRQALSLFGEASRSAAGNPGLARGLQPLDGVLVPTFGALYLGTTLLLPFVAIRLLGGERQSGALQLQLQLPFRRTSLVAAKLLALGAGWLGAVAIPLSAVAIWTGLGGFLHPPELLVLVAGHSLYALVVVALAFLASCLADSAAGAALLVLACTLGSWVLDFAALPVGGAWGRLSLTAVLKPFERGLLDLGAALPWLVAAAWLLALAAVWMHPGASRSRNLARSALLAAALAGLGGAASTLRASWDASFDRRNSFAVEEAEALGRIPARLEIEVFLRREDPRYQDFEREILGKLRRSVPRLRILAGRVDGTSRLGLGEDDRYGRIVYRYQGGLAESRSTSPEEVLPLLWDLTGVHPAAMPPESPIEGHPLDPVDRWSGGWFFGLLPLLILAAFLPANLPARRTP